MKWQACPARSRSFGARLFSFREGRCGFRRTLIPALNNRELASMPCTFEELVVLAAVFAFRFANSCEDVSDALIREGSQGMLTSCAASVALCGLDQRLPAVCPLTCGKCTKDAVCEDAADVVIHDGSQGMLQSCAAGVELCGMESNLADACPVTCGKCTTSSEDKPKEEPTVISFPLAL